jgi:hypothetical protein
MKTFSLCLKRSNLFIYCILIAFCSCNNQSVESYESKAFNNFFQKDQTEQDQLVYLEVDSYSNVNYDIIMANYNNILKLETELGFYKLTNNTYEKASVFGLKRNVIVFEKPKIGILHSTLYTKAVPNRGFVKFYRLQILLDSSGKIFTHRAIISYSSGIVDTLLPNDTLDIFKTFGLTTEISQIAKGYKKKLETERVRNIKNDRIRSIAEEKEKIVLEQNKMKTYEKEYKQRKQALLREYGIDAEMNPNSLSEAYTDGYVGDKIVRNSYVLLHGYIKEINSNDPSIFLEVSTGGPKIICIFESNNIANHLNVGEEIKIIGKCTGKNNSVVYVKHCVVFERFSCIRWTPSF